MIAAIASILISVAAILVEIGNIRTVRKVLEIQERNDKIYGGGST
jgi:hypothetical protein